MGLKQRIAEYLAKMIFGSGWNMFLPPSDPHMERKVNVNEASVVMAPVLWVMRQLPGAGIIITRNEEVITDHPMLDLVRRPNKYYGGRLLKMALAHDLVIDGNGYIVKIRNRIGLPVELWYVPHWMIKPAFPKDGSEFLSHYVYRPGGKEIHLDPSDVIHIKFGIDPYNQRLGISPLKSLLREVFTDQEASEFSAYVLENGGVPGLVISPKDGTIPQRDVDAVKEYIEKRFTGHNRGKPLALSGPTEIREYGYSPDKMDLSALRNVSEERVCACIGVAAAEVGFGTGLETTKVGATMHEMRKKSYEDAVMPLQEIIADAIESSLLPDFEPKPELYKVGWDWSKVKVLQEDENQRWLRLSQAVQAGWMTVAEAQRQAGVYVDDTQNVYLRGIAMIETPASVVKGSSGIVKKSYHTTRIEQAFMDEIGKRRERVLSGWLKVQIKSFEDMGEDFGNRYIDYVEKKNRKAIEDLENEIMVGAIVDAIDWMKYRDKVLKYEQLYMSITKEVVEGMNIVMGAGINMVDPIELSVLERCGTRKGLIDLDSQTKEAMFKAIRDAKEQGMGDTQGIARKIREYVGRGRYSDVRTRAEIIGRTEVRYAQNIAVAEAGKEAGATGYRVIDGVYGSPRSCDYCISVSGLTIRPNEVEWFAGEEHPNGTRDFVPLFEADLEFDTIPAR